VGVLLTGMGRDGAEGLRRLHEAGALTIAQDEPSSVVWGMPAAALALGAVQVELPLSRIGAALAAAVAAPDLTPGVVGPRPEPGPVRS
jgi:two-component system chemotaxis response regulator CheB